MKSPREDPQAKADRERERRLSELDRTATTQDQAAALTSDLRAVYGLRKLGKQQGGRAITGGGTMPTTAYGTPAIVGNPNSFSNQAMARRTLPSYLRPLGAQNGQSR